MIPEVLREYEEDYEFFYDAAMRRTVGVGESMFPDDVVTRILAGEHPIKVFREFRRYSIDALARKSGVSAEYLRKLEAGIVNASRDTKQRIASTLRVAVEEIA